jgi:hypothetical protein
MSEAATKVKKPTLKSLAAVGKQKKSRAERLPFEP